ASKHCFTFAGSCISPRPVEAGIENKNTKDSSRRPFIISSLLDAAVGVVVDMYAVSERDYDGATPRNLTDSAPIGARRTGGGSIRNTPIRLLHHCLIFLLPEQTSPS